MDKRALTKVHDWLWEIPKSYRGGPLRFKKNDLDQILRDGATRAVEIGFGTNEDLDRIESRGAIDGADPKFVSDHARGRGGDQLGTIGSGNHFVEIDRVDRVFDPTFGI